MNELVKMQLLKHLTVVGWKYIYHATGNQILFKRDYLRSQHLASYKNTQ